MNIQEKVVVITGACSGLGETTCRELVKSGAKIVAFDLNKEQGEKLQAEIGEDLQFAVVNVTEEESVKSGIEAAVEKFGRIDVCVNCAGIAPAGKTIGKKGVLPLENFSQAINVNLIGTFNVLRLAVEQMAKNDPNENGERGVIINTASVAAYDGQKGQAGYSASKAGVAGMTLPIARDLANLGVRVMAIAPGIFDTAMMQGMSGAVRQPLLDVVQFPKRFGDPAEYAFLVQHIIENTYLNGEVIRLDAALRMEP
ncbi:MAG: 3-hydroxyacyl-CoA dehydrogenase [Cellvibrionaceae bacterium]